MGLHPEILIFFHKVFNIVGFESYTGLRMCELGNQLLKYRCKEFLEERNIPNYKTGKQYFQHIGFDHVSIDINGRNGALRIDLRKNITDKRLVGTFDVLTNSGTTEHIRNQFETFKNVHNLVKRGGIFLHVVPKIGHWKEHPKCFAWYSFEFFYKLCGFCNYEILDEESINYLGEGMDLVVVGLRKTEDNNFITEEQFSLCWKNEKDES
jgi:hypothetical protein